MSFVENSTIEFILSKIKDGSIFEEFAQQFLSQVLGCEFIPIGGIGDKGIDGLENILIKKGSYETHLYQISIEKDSISKIKKTLNRLCGSGIDFEKLYYVTNQEVKDIPNITEKFYDKYKKLVLFYDFKWFKTNANSTPGTINVIESFATRYLHEYEKPGKAYEVIDFVNDPTLFVFLRQQWDENKRKLNLHSILADTLILYSLEKTDPNKNIFKTEDELKDDISKLISFDFKMIMPFIRDRLNVLSKKPRRINYHPAIKGYVLPFETRVEIREKNLNDTLLCDKFNEQTELDFNYYLSELKITSKEGLTLIKNTLNQIFHKQGLEFSNFITNRKGEDSYERDLNDVINKIVNESNENPKNRGLIKDAIILTIRKMVYHGTKEQNQFLMKLSNTYMMMFMLHCNPQICSYFQIMASKLNVYVCTSIIIPALSEFFLSELNKRNWNLLIGAKEAGVTLIINETILSELVGHFKSISKIYSEQYKSNEDIYLSNEEQIHYIDEIMIRAYFYAKFRGEVRSFRDFLDKFIDPDLKNIETEIIAWLKDTFNIKYISDSSLGIELDQAEFMLLYEALKIRKKSETKAKNDTNIILTLQKIREKYNETDDSGIFGYKTWWLSIDTVTQEVVNQIFKNKYKNSCYMRPDFLYNYISLSPKKKQIDSIFERLFPSMLGINLSYHLKPEVNKVIRDLIAEHKNKPRARIIGTLSSLTERLKTEPNHDLHFIKNFFNTKIKE